MRYVDRDLIPDYMCEPKPEAVPVAAPIKPKVDLSDPAIQTGMVRAFVLLTSYLRTLPQVDQEIVDLLSRNYTRPGLEKHLILDEIREMIFEREWRKEPEEIRKAA